MEKSLSFGCCSQSRIARIEAICPRDQMQRAAISIPSNITEGAERDSRQDFIRFLRIAKGSAAELRTQCYIAKKLELITKTDAEEFIQETKELSAMLQGLVRSLEKTEN